MSFKVKCIINSIYKSGPDVSDRLTKGKIYKAEIDLTNPFQYFKILKDDINKSAFYFHSRFEVLK